ncbi:MAG TPA: hypothetical protein VMS56_03270 [Thermoanaerobaculia bacterium]|nr:hypothetical protein [Thermoanaerobaculia bacterium]
MSSAGEAQNLPTMVIPRGTEIRFNAEGQLSIRTPGNLIIQNSGAYGEIESTGGSIRIDENVHVEAVVVRAAQGCFIQGTLTAWRVHAKRIALDERARAYIMLQESERLELGKTSRLVGNFANEKEVYLMLGKFSTQLKALPGSVDLQTQASLGSSGPSFIPPAVSPEAPGDPSGGRPDELAPAAEPAPELSENLAQALEVLERELRRPDLDGADASPLRTIVAALRDRDVQRTAQVYRESFADIRQPSESMRLAFNLIDSELRYL